MPIGFLTDQQQPFRFIGVRRLANQDTHRDRD
jgi:hypothetical protein